MNQEEHSARLIELDLAVGRYIVADSYLVCETTRRSLPVDSADERRLNYFGHLRSHLQRVFGAWPVHVLESTLVRETNSSECRIPHLQVSARFVSWPTEAQSTIEYLIVAWFQEQQCPLLPVHVASELRLLDWGSLAKPCDY